MTPETYLWTHTIDLVFDCYYASNLSPFKQGHTTYVRIKAAAAGLAQHLRSGLRKPACPPGRHWLQRTELMLGELKLHLVIARGLGFLSERAFYKLHTRTEKLAGFLANPRVQRRFV